MSIYSICIIHKTIHLFNNLNIGDSIMSKKIYVSTVRQMADVEVLFVNASLIAKAINANNAIQDIIESAKAQGSIVPRYEPGHDEEGEEIRNEYGEPVMVPVLDENQNQIIDYTSHDLSIQELAKLNTVVKNFLAELVNAFEA